MKLQPEPDWQTSKIEYNVIQLANHVLDITDACILRTLFSRKGSWYSVMAQDITIAYAIYDCGPLTVFHTMYDDDLEEVQNVSKFLSACCGISLSTLQHHSLTPHHCELKLASASPSTAQVLLPNTMPTLNTCLKVTDLAEASGVPKGRRTSSFHFPELQSRLVYRAILKKTVRRSDSRKRRIVPTPLTRFPKSVFLRLTKT
ncbi:hypothetical protein IW262DRAFT_1302895 [Armillaria fumosa]|nr:hypothetical protein IW262DRAFT_1302895 [Armillaria fumosa]